MIILIDLFVCVYSVVDARVAVIGNIYSFVFSNYPPNGFAALKV